MRFGTGQLEKPDEYGNSDSLTHLRTQFLQIAGELKPEILQDLETELFPLYCKIPLICYNAKKRGRKRTFADDLQRRYFVTNWAKQYRPMWYQLEQSEPDWRSDYPSPKSRPEAIEAMLKFMTLMFNWSKTHNLNASWCRNHAYETLDLWSVVDKYRKLRMWQYLPWDARDNRVEMKCFEPEYPKFDTKIEFDLKEKLIGQLTFYPSFGGRDEITKSLNDLQKKVDFLAEQTMHFMDEREAAAKREGHTASIAKSNIGHISWFAEVQILGTRFADLAEEYYAASEETIGARINTENRTKVIRKAVNAMSRQLGLPLNTDQSRKGRRPGTKIIKKTKPASRSTI
jgi:hypothetical protein